jgi:hypothetical protein
MESQLSNLFNKVIISNNLIFIDGWSLLHFIGGFIIIKYLLSEKRNPLYSLFIILVLYEIYEIIFNIQESSLNRIWDLIIGMIGGYVCLRWFI